MDKKENVEIISLKVWFLVIFIFLILITFVVVGFYFYGKRKPVIYEKEKVGGYVTLNYSSTLDSFNVVNSVPTTDEVGKALSIDGSYFDFSINVDLRGVSTLNYELSAKIDNLSSDINTDDIIIYLEKEESGTYTSVLEPTPFKKLEKKSDIGASKDNMLLVSQKRKKSITDNYRLRSWVSDKSLATNANYSILLEVKAVGK